MLNFKEHLEAIEPHNLVRSRVRRQHIGPFPANQIKQVLKIALTSLLDLNGLLSSWIVEATRDELLHVDKAKLFLRRLSILEDHIV